jgi:hypothetical protein
MYSVDAYQKKLKGTVEARVLDFSSKRTTFQRGINNTFKATKDLN